MRDETWDVGNGKFKIAILARMEIDIEKC